MGNYFLIARDMNTNKFKVISLKNKWYVKNGTDYYSRSNKLEAIDLVTTRFNSKSDMAQRMFSNGYIDHVNYDFFIVSKFKRDGEEKLKFQEVIYNEKDDRIRDFREIANSSLNGTLKRCTKNIRLFDKFVTKMYYNEDFDRVLKAGLTPLPYKVTSIFKDVKDYSYVPYGIKYQNAWLLDNYGISRGIVDTLNRFDNLNEKNRSCANHLDYFRKLSDERNKLKKDLLTVCDKDYMPEQLSLFDMQPEIAKKEEKPVKPLSLFDKKKYIISSLISLGVRSFDTDYDKFKFDLSKYDMTDEEAKVLNKGIRKSIIKSAYWYNFHEHKLRQVKDGPGDATVLMEDMEADLRDLANSLRDEAVVNKTYDFCVILNNVRDRNKNHKGVMTYTKGRSKE